MVKRLFDVNGLGNLRSLMETTKKRQLFAMASAFHNSVVRASLTQNSDL